MIFTRKRCWQEGVVIFFMLTRENKAQKRPIINLCMSSAVSVDSTKSTVTADVYQ